MKVRETGLAGAWFYWNSIVSSVAGMYLIGRLWRRAEITTVVEFYDIRYGGKAKIFARVYQAVYSSLITYPLYIAMGYLGTIKLLRVLLNFPPTVDIFCLSVDPATGLTVCIVLFALIYAMISGLNGIVWTSVFQYAVLLVSSYILFVLVYFHIGGPDVLTEKIAGLKGTNNWIGILPNSWFLITFWLLIQPLLTLEGNASDNQRFMAVTNEKQVIIGGLWRIINHHVIRTWPWFFCGLASLVLFSPNDLLNHQESYDPELAFPLLILTYLPNGFLGLMVGSLIGAFISSLNSITHNASAIIVNDLYRPYLFRNKTDYHYLSATRFLMPASTILGIFAAHCLDGIFEVVATLSILRIGSSLVTSLRWFWWRINIQADIVAHVTSPAVAIVLLRYKEIFGTTYTPQDFLMNRFDLSGWDTYFAITVCMVACFVSMLWLLAVYVFPQEKESTLKSFYERVRPYGFWNPIRNKCNHSNPLGSFRSDLISSLKANLFVFAILASSGSLIFGKWLIFAISVPLISLSFASLKRELITGLKST